MTIAEARDLIHGQLWSWQTVGWLLTWGLYGPSPCTVAAQQILRRLHEQESSTPWEQAMAEMTEKALTIWSGRD